MAWSKNSFDTKFELDKQYGSVVEMARRCKNATDIFFYIETIFEKDADPDGVEMLRKEFTKAGYGPEFDEDMANVVVNAMKTPILAATRGNINFEWNWSNNQFHLYTYGDGDADPDVGIALAQLFAQICGVHGAWVATWATIHNREPLDIGTAVYTRTQVYRFDVAEWQKMKVRAVNTRRQRTHKHDMRRAAKKAADAAATKEGYDVEFGQGAFDRLPLSMQMAEIKAYEAIHMVPDDVLMEALSLAAKPMVRVDPPPIDPDELQAFHDRLADGMGVPRDMLSGPLKGPPAQVGEAGAVG